MLTQRRQLPHWAVVFGFALMSLAFLGSDERSGGNALVLKAGYADPTDEHATVTVGETLSMRCDVSSYNLQRVGWEKRDSFTNVRLTGNSRVLARDSRVSISEFLYYYDYDGRNYKAYSVHITDVMASDSGEYICSSTWYDGDTASGSVFISVNYFPNENPVCSSNKTDTSSLDDTAVWCDTMGGHPRVTITWMVQRTGEVIAGRTYYYLRMEQERLWRVFQLRQQLRHEVLVCTVTSSAFPGRSRTCSIGPFMEFISTTEMIDITTAPAETTQVTSTHAITNPEKLDTTTPLETTPDPSSHVIASTPKLDTRSISAQVTNPTLPGANAGTATPKSAVTGVLHGDTGSAFNAGPISAVAIPAFIIILAILLGILKRRRRQTDTDEKGKLGRATAETNYFSDAGRGSETECHVARTAPDGTESACETSFTQGDISKISPYEVEFNPARHSVPYAEVRERNEESPEGDDLYEHVNSSSTAVESGTNVVPGDDTDEDEPGATGSSSDESDEGMVDNPIYQSYD